MSKILKFITNFGCSSPINDDEIEKNAEQTPTKNENSQLLPFTPEQCERFEKYLKRKPSPTMKDIPKDIIGLGHRWYPIVIQTKNTQTLEEFVKVMKIIIRPCNDTAVGPDMTKEIFYDEDDVITEIAEDAVFVGMRPMGHHLGNSPRFFDPQEIVDSLNQLKQQENTLYTGIMSASDLVQLSVGDENFYLNQSNCRNLCQILTTDQRWKIKVIIEPRCHEDNRIFNWLFKIFVKDISLIKQ